MLPPVNPDDATGPERSPYPVSLVDLVLRFSTSPERRKILNGLLRFRQELHAIGLISGFQWIDGSFIEDIEFLEERAPQDVDVVTFVEYLGDFVVDDRVTAILEHSIVKRDYLVDH